jgi:hypothetical protein
MSGLHAVPDMPELQKLHARLDEYSLAGHWQTRTNLVELASFQKHLE